MSGALKQGEPDPPSWAEHGRDWPNRGASLFVRAGGLRWHVQRAGSGPVVLLLHGTGAATHSWRDLLPLLARRMTVIAPDLPGHGFTALPAPHLLSLPNMARLVAALLQALGVEVDYAVGHSAGAAILARMVLDGRIAPRGLMSLNGALEPPPGVQAPLFPAVARLLAGLPPVPGLVAWAAGDPRRVTRLLDNTGSAIDPRGQELYGRLMRQPSHVAGALGMMSRWNLAPLRRDLKRLRVPVTLVVGGNDRMVPPTAADALMAELRNARLVPLPGLGHLAHEEQPQVVADLVAAAMAGGAPAAA